MMIATNRVEIAHDSQAAVEAAANQIFEGQGIAAKIEALAAEYAEKVLPYAGDMETAKTTARRWAVEALCDYVAAIADYEVMLIK